MNLRILPLGGLGEIGRNCLLMEYGEDALLVDCGIQFPGPHLPGVDRILPDFAPLRERRSRLRGLLVTHGHEDHLGAIPNLLQELSLPVFASRFTLSLLERRLAETSIKADLREVFPRRVQQLGAFEIEPIRVTHSIPDSLAFAISCPAGTVVHTGDFKIDHAPIDAEVTDLARFAQLGERGVLCLMSDSTNANREGSCPGELTVGPALRELITTAPGRVVIGLFASNLQRLQRILQICAVAGRKVVLNGRSLEQNVDLAQSLHRLGVPAGLLISPDQAQALTPRKLCIVSTGAQAEPRSGLLRLASGTHPSLRIEAGDRVIFSASQIPGNELAIQALVNQLARLHVSTFQEPEYAIHVSGHGYRNDQRLLLRLLKPQSFIALHGEAIHLAHHRSLAIECGVAPDRCLEVYDGDWVELGDQRAAVVGREALQDTYLDRWGGSLVAEDVVRDRQRSAEGGVITAVAQLDRESGALLRPLEIQVRGLSAADRNRYLPEALRELTQELNSLPTALKLDLPAVEEEVVRVLRRLAKRLLDRRPLVLPVILR